MDATSHILKVELDITDEADQLNLAYAKRYRQWLSAAGNL
jgi:hypothetical protein